jgi:tetratricopeptide (TPR) repeat protein
MQGHSRFDEAKQAYQQALDLYKKLGDKDRLANVYYHFSWLLWDIDYLDAWNLCQEALKALEGAEDSPSYARLLAEAGRTAFFRNISDQMVPLCQRARAMAERLGDLEVGADASITLAFREEDPNEGIRILNEVIALTETEGLLRSAGRAHTNLAAHMCNYLIDYEGAYRHYLRSAKIARQIGDIQRMMFALSECFSYYIRIGRMKDVEERLSIFLKESTAPQSDVKRAHETLQCTLLAYRGEWRQYLELYRPRLEDRRKGGNIQQIAWGNIYMTDSILELNRFGSHEDMSEVEAMLNENIEINWNVVHSLFMLVIAFARLNQFEKAREYYLQAENQLSKNENNMEKELRSRADFELAFAESRWEDAVTASETSIEINKSCNYRWGWARRLIDLGDALVGRNEPGDLELARETYEQSLDMFTEMGAPGYIKVLEERLGVS